MVNSKSPTGVKYRIGHLDGNILAVNIEKYVCVSDWENFEGYINIDDCKQIHQIRQALYNMPMKGNE